MGTEVSLQSQLTLVELAKRTVNGNFIQIAEVLTQINEIMSDAVWVEANQKTRHVGTQRTHLPTGSHRTFNAGVTPSASSTKQLEESMCMLEDYSIVDVALAKLSGNAEAFRSSEDYAFLEGMGQTMIGKLFYGNMGTNPEEIDGLATRYNLTSMANVDGASGTGSDTTSIWLIEWGPQKAHLIYPQGGVQNTVQMNDLGEKAHYTAVGASQALFQAYITHFKIDYGWFVHDSRAVQRMANIEYTGSSNTFDDDILIDMISRIPNPSAMGQARIYVNRYIWAQMWKWAKDKTNVNYSAGEAAGGPVLRFSGIPIKMCEQITIAETAIA